MTFFLIIISTAINDVRFVWTIRINAEKEGGTRCLKMPDPLLRADSAGNCLYRSRRCFGNIKDDAADVFAGAMSFVEPLVRGIDCYRSDARLVRNRRTRWFVRVLDVLDRGPVPVNSL